MRDIKFKGKTFMDRQWVCGDLIQYRGKNRMYILPIEEMDVSCYYEVFPETVSQYSGLKDKNGKEIYEGDILSASRTVTGIPLPNGKTAEIFGNVPTETRTWNEILVVEIKVSASSISFILPEEGDTYQERGKKLQWEVIGNIYENPDLMPKA